MAAGEKSFSELWLLMKGPLRGTLPVSQINMANNFKMTLLHLAAREGDWPAAMMLIRKNANLFLTDGCNRTVLHFAVEQHCFFAFMLTQEIIKCKSLDLRGTLILALNEIFPADPTFDPAMLSLLIQKLKQITSKDFASKYFIEIFAEMKLEAAAIDQYLPHVIAHINPDSVLSIQRLFQSLNEMSLQGSTRASQFYLGTLQQIIQLSERLATPIFSITGAALKEIYPRAISTPKRYDGSPIHSKPVPSTLEDEDTLVQSDEGTPDEMHYSPRRPS